MAGAATIITYTRGSTYVRNLISGAGASATYAHGLVGKLEVGGHSFDAFERMDGFMTMDGDKTYQNSQMHWHTDLRYVINPWLGKEPEKTKYNILFHNATVPSELKGCVTAGKLVGQKMTESTATFTEIWRLVGGKKGSKEPKDAVTVTVKVVGQMKRLSACTAHGAG